MIRRPVYQLITQVYEVFENDKSESPIGKACVVDGLIESLMIKKNVSESFYGQILSRILRAISEDADKYNSNLSIKVAEPNSVRLKRFLERYGFRETAEGIYKRIAGSSIPPSVIY
jgi:hypothetical protein